MTDSQALGSGEIGRSLARIEKGLDDLRAEVRDRHHILSNKVEAYQGKVAVLELRADTNEVTVKELSKDVHTLSVKAAGISGIVALLAWLVQLFWKH